MPAFALLRTAVAAIATVAATSACAEDCSLKQLASVTLTSDGDHLLLPVTAEGRQLTFLLELGDAQSGVTTKTAEELSLARSAVPGWLQYRLGGEVVTTLYTVPALQIDHLTARNFKLLEIPPLASADGQLGLDIASANDLDLDFAHDKANIFSRDHCAGKVLYWTPPSGAVAAIPLREEGGIKADMILDGQSLAVGITTVGRSLMGMNVAHRLFGIDEHSAGMRMIDSGNSSHPVYRYAFHELDAQGLKIENPDIVIAGKTSDPECSEREHLAFHSAPVVERCFGGADLYLGLSVLRRLHLFFAFGEKMLYATAAS